MLDMNLFQEYPGHSELSSFPALLPCISLGLASQRLPAELAKGPTLRIESCTAGVLTDCVVLKVNAASTQIIAESWCMGRCKYEVLQANESQ